MQHESLLSRLKRFDDERMGLPAEHWFTLGAGVWLLSRRTATPLGQWLSAAAGLALIYRAASGRDGLMSLWDGWTRRAARRRSRERYIDAMEPYSRRVRVPAISEPLGRTALMR